MKDIISELKQIKKNLLFAVEFRDGLLVKSEVKKIDSLIHRLSEKLNEEIRESVLIDFLDNIKRHPDINIPYKSKTVVDSYMKSIEERT